MYSTVQYSSPDAPWTDRPNSHHLPSRTRPLPLFPQSHAESTIGAWQLCLEIVAIVACLTNLVLAVLVCEHVSLYTPDGLSDHLGSTEAKVTIPYFTSIKSEHVSIVALLITKHLPDVMRSRP